MKAKILVVDDQADIRTLLGEFLEDEGYTVLVASDGQEALKLIEYEQPGIVLLDIWLNDKRFDGIAILDIIREKFPDVVTIMMSGHGTIETAIATLKKGAFDFIEKPFQSERLSSMLEKAKQVIDLRKELSLLKGKVEHQSDFIGSSKSTEAVRKELLKLAHTNARVMLVGPSGVGKTQAARFIHVNSERAKMPFVEVDCAVLDDKTFSEAFFGAEAESAEGYPVVKVGLLEQANKGTLVLENVQDLPKAVSSKLAHVLHSKKFQRIGGERSYDIDVRFLSTLVPLSKVGTQPSHQIREDLYHRLAVASIEIPPLSNRVDDIMDLVRYFYEVFSGKSKVIVSQEAKFILMNYSWPGNVRQLKNVVEWISIVLKEGGTEILPKYLPRDLKEPSENSPAQEGGDLFLGPLKEARERFEKAYIEFHLHCSQGNIKKTAEEIGMERTALHRKIKNLGLDSLDGS